MKKFLVIIILLTLSNSCKIKVCEKEYVRGYSVKELISTSLYLYEPSAEFKSLLDSTIRHVNYCNLYNNKPLSFITTLYHDSDSNFFLAIENTTDMYEYDYTKCNGVFYYCGYQFVHTGIVLDTILKKAKGQIEVFHVRSKSLVKLRRPEGEFFHSSWVYIYLDDRFKCISYNDCNNYWFDENYYVSE